MPFKPKFKAVILSYLLFPMLGICATGNSLYEQLNSSNPADRSGAYGYIAAIADYEDMLEVRVMFNAMASNENANKSNFLKPFFCAPEGSTNGQMFDIVRKYLENNPSERNKAAVVLVRNSLILAWPCKFSMGDLKK